MEMRSWISLKQLETSFTYNLLCPRTSIARLVLQNSCFPVKVPNPDTLMKPGTLLLQGSCKQLTEQQHQCEKFVMLLPLPSHTVEDHELCVARRSVN